MSSSDQAPKVAWYRDAVIRGYISQAVLLAALILVGYSLISNAVDNLREQRIASGFGFLDLPAGFGISQSLIDYTEESTYGRVFWVGLLNTLNVSFWCVILSTILGFAAGVARLSKNWMINQVATAFVEISRNLPHLFHIFFWYAVIRTLPSAREALQPIPDFFLSIRGLYMPKPVAEPMFWGVFASFILGLFLTVAYRRYAKRIQAETGQQLPVFSATIACLLGIPVLTFFILGMPMSLDIPQLKGFNFVGGIRVIPEFVALVIALSMYTAGFIAEIVRAGILAVSHGQTEAAYSLGLTPGRTLRFVVIPQAMRVITPPLTSQYLNVIKNSTLGVAIGFPDFFAIFSGTVLNQTGQAIEIMGITMALYLVISLIASAFMNWYNRRMAIVER